MNDYQGYYGVATVRRLPCCGTAEISGFQIRPYHGNEPFAEFCRRVWWSSSPPGGRVVVTKLHDSEEAAATELLQGALNAPKYYKRATKFAYLIWFRKSRARDKTYEFEALHKVVKMYPGVLDLGTIKNPNTNNYLTGYLIKE